jgi:hypothetical protein
LPNSRRKKLTFSILLSRIHSGTTSKQKSSGIELGGKRTAVPVGARKNSSGKPRRPCARRNNGRVTGLNKNGGIKRVLNFFYNNGI